MFEKSPILIVIDGFRRFWLDVERVKLVPYIAGGEGPVGSAPETPEVPANFDGLSDEDLTDLHGRLEAKFTAERPDAATKAQIDQLKGYREAQKRIADEVTRRRAEVAENAEALKALDETVGLPGDEPDPEDAETPAEPAETPAEPATPADAAAPAPEAIAASLTAGGVAGARQPQTAAEKAPAPAKTRPRAPMQAAASQTVVPYQQEVTLGDIGRIADKVKSDLRPVREVVRAYVASVPAFEDMGDLGQELLSTANGAQRNDALIREAVEAFQARRAERLGRPAVKTAAICDPLDIIREIPDYVSQADPLSGAFPSRGMTRLGFNFTPAVSLAAVAAGTQFGWDDTDQASVDPTDPDTWKPCLDATCPSPCTITAVASTGCLTFDVTTEMSNPERIRDLMSKLTALRIRDRTIGLLDLIDGLSVDFTKTGSYSLLPDTIYAIGKVLPRLLYAERLDAEDYTLFLPPGFAESLVIDKNGKEFADSAELSQQADAAARSLGALFGLEVIRLRDETDALFDALPAVATPTALDDGPCAWPLRLVHTPSALYGSTGVIDTGVQSDPQLARQNKRQWFQEEFVLLTKHGSPPWAKITLTSASSGSRAAASTKLTCS